MASEETVLEALVLLETAFPTLRSTPPTVKAWHMALGRFTDHQVALGAEMVMRYHTYGQPAPAHVAAMIQGRPKKVLCDSVYAATYKTIREFEWEARGDAPPAGLEPAEARRVLEEGQNTPVLPAATDDSTEALAESLGNGMDPYRGG